MHGAVEIVARILARMMARIAGYRKPAKIVLECPECKQITMARSHVVMQYDDRGKPESSTHFIICDVCKKTFNTDSFKPDSSGVYQIRTWDCPQCAHLNPNTTFQCESCSYRLV